MRLISSFPCIAGILIVIGLWLWGLFFSSENTEQAAVTRAGDYKRIIYATYLSQPVECQNYTVSDFYSSADPYFDATRILTYQILHAPETRTRLNIEFVVFVHENVDQDKRSILTSDGAQIVETADFRAEWIRPKDQRWADAQTKIRLWQMTQYDLIVFLDADSVLTRSIDYFLDDLKTNGMEIPLPERYILAGVPQLRPNHSSNPLRVPEDYWDKETLNTGFMILQPSLELFRYLEAVMIVENSFDGSIADQSVLNFVFSPLGPIPWINVNDSWNIQWPWSADIKAGYAVLHEKWWAPMHWETRDYFLSWYWRMVGYQDTRIR
ncbi:hypothetical protein N7456_010737 [Penicillium angulare]|uniref:Glycosyltransferase family 8 protein n=1 Tax=Penicillium angulare TaxID=116970 RepID=A0A9W9JZI7_9EURO|nr:hypothetical protein N7456_010737 [Penicillium angulare]